MVTPEDFTRIPGPPPMPLLGSRGNLLQFLRDPVAYMRTLYRAYGEIAAFVKGRKGMFFAFGPKYNQRILGDPALFYSTSLILPGPEDSAQRRLTTAIFGMNSEPAMRWRRLLMPPFHKKAIEGYRDSMVTTTEEMLHSWRPRQHLDVACEMRNLTIRLTSEILFGIDDCSKPAAIAEMAERWLKMGTSPAVRLLPVDWPGTPYYRMLRFAEGLERKILAMIAQRRAKSSEGIDILSILLRVHEGDGAWITGAELVGHTNLLFLAGYETTFNALTWTLFLLSQHPSIMADLLDELEGTLKGEAPTVEQLSRLCLLDRVIKESMRLLPPIVYNTRDSIEPFELGRYSLPKGTTVGFSQYITHHMPDLYPQPEKFLPQRWLTINPSPYEYMPFGAGPRMCLGGPFAIMALKVSLPMILQRYRLTVAPGAIIDRKGLITLSPKYGMPMLIRPQDRQFAKSTVYGNIHEMVDLGTH
jgi:cytochrome P450